MSDEINSRADAKLKRLPVEIHCEIVERLAAPDTTQLDVLAWLKKYHRLDSSSSSFSRALPFIRQRVKAHGREQVILAKMSEKKAAERDITDAELFKWGQRQFSEMAIADEDPQAWATLQRVQLEKESAAFKAELEKLKIELKKKDQQLEERRVQLLEKKAEAFDAAKGVMADKELTEEQRAARMREVFGIG